jgi:hypothetical protein
MVAAEIHTRSPAHHVIQHLISRRSHHARYEWPAVPARVCDHQRRRTIAHDPRTRAYRPGSARLHFLRKNRIPGRAQGRAATSSR